MSNNSHLFWGKSAPLASLWGGGLLIMASARLAHAIVISGAILWVSGLSVLVLWAAKKILPQAGKSVCQAVFGSFMCSIYLLLIWLLNPLITFEIFFAAALVPFFCAASGIFNMADEIDVGDAVTQAFAEAGMLGLLIIIFSIIREPLGFLSLSLPAGSQGLFFLFSAESESFFPIRIIASSAGALLLLGYAIGLYRYFRSIHGPRENDL